MLMETIFINQHKRKGGTMNGSSDAYEVDWKEEAGRLVVAARADSGWHETVAAELIRPGDRVAVDVGCGGAGMALALAHTLGHGGLVLAVDGDPEVLAAARSQLDRAHPAETRTVLSNLDDGVETLRGALPPGGADLIWAAASVHHLADQQAAITALAGLLAPGGRLALAEGGLRPRHLPWDLGLGEPGLEMRLDAAQDAWFAGMRAGLKGSTPMPYGWTAALRRAGLTEVTTRSDLIEHPVPLADDMRDRLLQALSHRVDRMRPTGLLAPGDLDTWERLLDPSDSHWLGHRDDLYWLEARSVHIGQRQQ
jgi:SAM-dependent methyltransferase